jgi:hypothetical protein
MAQEAHAEATDWLDEFCWQCGSEDVAPSRDGRLLCHTCRAEMFAPPSSPESGVRVMHRLYWESHPLERCWRCLTRAVDPDDQLGMCPRCRAEQTRRSPSRSE